MKKRIKIPPFPMPCHKYKSVQSNTAILPLEYTEQRYTAALSFTITLAYRTTNQHHHICTMKTLHETNITLWDKAMVGKNNIQ